MAKTIPWREMFKGKRVTMLGLGLLGRGVNVAKFLARYAAILTITDLKTKDQLSTSLKALKKYKDIKYVLGEHRLSDFRKRDFIMKAAGVSLTSPYIKEARKYHTPIEMDASLFMKLAPKGVIFVGITGTRGKSTVTHLVHHILKVAKKRAFLGGNIRGQATLPLLTKVRPGDIIVLELDSWQLQGFGESRVSPHIAVFTTFFRDHMNYYKGDMEAYFKDKSHIFIHQKNHDVCIVGKQAYKEIKKRHTKNKGRMIVVGDKNLPSHWRPHILGTHNRYNAALAKAVCNALGVSDLDIRKGIENFHGVPGRLEFIRKVGDVAYYNDTTATTPDANKAALLSLKKKKRHIILIAGGNDKELVYGDMAKLIHKIVKSLILIKGTATEKIVTALPKKRKYPVYMVGSMKEAVESANTCAHKGDVVLLSPGAASFGVFKNEFDRGDQFVRAVKKIR